MIVTNCQMKFSPSLKKTRSTIIAYCIERGVNKWNLSHCERFYPLWHEDPAYDHQDFAHLVKSDSQKKIGTFDEVWQCPFCRQFQTF